MTPIRRDACPICSSGEFSTITRKGANSEQRYLSLSRQKYNGLMDGWFRQLDLEICQCTSCGHLWHHTHPDQQSLFQMYAAQATNKKAVQGPPNPSFMDKELRLLLRLAQKQLGRQEIQLL